MNHPTGLHHLGNAPTKQSNHHKRYRYENGRSFRSIETNHQVKVLEYILVGIKTIVNFKKKN
ncbi:hypothetical protein CR513_29526, partial [Mucuna pruriens]